MPRVGAEGRSVEAARENRDGRWLMRETAQKHTRQGSKKDERLRTCGRRMAHGRDQVDVVVSPETGCASYSGVQTCGSVWLCAMCSGRIRVGRQEEVTRATEEHTRRGGGLEFVTLTERHYRGDALGMLFDGAAEGWRDVVRDHTVRALRKMRPWGFVRAVEVTYTWDNGWHAHLHVVLFTDEPWTEQERSQLRRAVESVWLDSVQKRTGRRPALDYAVNWKGNATAAQVAAYVTKPQEAGWGLGAELTRADVKRSGSVYPLDLPLIAEGLIVGDGVTHAEEMRRRALADRLWHEYIDATHRRRMLTWSRGLKADLIPDEPELTDEELAEQEQAAPTLVGSLQSTEFYAVRRANLLHVLLVAVEEHGRNGFDYVRSLALQRAGAAGWLTDEEYHRYAVREGRDAA